MLRQLSWPIVFTQNARDAAHLKLARFNSDHERTSSTRFETVEELNALAIHEVPAGIEYVQLRPVLSTP